MTESQEIIKKALADLNSRLIGYGKCADYYSGRHQLCFASEKFKNAFGKLFKTFADNLMPTVVDAVKDNLLVTGFNVESGGDLADEAWKIWQTNRMGRRSGQVHLEALRSGDAFVIVWLNAEGVPTIYPQMAGTCTVKYDTEEPGKIKWATKVWMTDDKKCRLNLYFPDRIEKYITEKKSAGALPLEAKQFVEFRVEGEEYPLKNEWGVVPVFHFANNADIGGVGQSELRDVMPLQDALNKAVLDMLVAMEFAAFRQRYVTGIEIEYDSDGKPIPPFVPGVERLWATESPDAKFGEFEATDLTQFLKVQTDFRIEVARVSATPLHYFMLQSGDFPSGEALKTAEKRFLKKITDRQEAFGETWADVMTLCLKMQGKSADSTQLFTQWMDAAALSAKELMEMLVLKKAVGVPEETLWSEAGYGESDIEEMKAVKKANAEAAVAAFNAGEES